MTISPRRAVGTLILCLASCQAPQPVAESSAAVSDLLIVSAVPDLAPAPAARTLDPARAAMDVTPSRAAMPAVDPAAAEARKAEVDAVASAPQARRGPRTGDWELTLGGIGFNDEEFEVGGGNLSLSVGHFLTDMLELSVRQNLSFSDPGPGSDFWDGSTRLAVDLHFGKAAFVPYIGANIGWVYGESIDETAAAGPEAGLKYYVSDSAFVVLAAEFLFFFDKNDVIGDAIEDGEFIYNLGIGLRF